MKKKFLLIYLLLSTIFLAAQSDWGEVKWDNGLKYEDPNNKYKIKFGGRIMLDGISVWPEQNGVMDTIVPGGSGVEFRRVRLYTAGQIYGNIKYKLQFDFAGGQGVLKDAYITITKIPGVGNLQIGHFKEPIGMELLTSSKYITMMERGLTDPLTPERNTGAMLFNNQFNKRMVWALGYFLPSDNFGTYVGDKYHITGRVAGTPLYNDGKENSIYKVIHLGTSITHQYQANSKYTLKSRPESHLLDPIVLAEIDVAKAVNQIGGELALIFGPFSFQSEYIYTNAQTAPGSTLQKSNYHFSAFYAAISWFITGEHKNYKSSAGIFDRVKPKKNFGSEKGPGAWEIALRYSDLDLDDTDVNGGELANITAGLNWHMNPASRIMFNYVIANLKDVGNISICQMRIQVDF